MRVLKFDKLELIYGRVKFCSSFEENDFLKCGNIVCFALSAFSLSSVGSVINHCSCHE